MYTSEAIQNSQQIFLSQSQKKKIMILSEHSAEKVRQSVQIWKSVYDRNKLDIFQYQEHLFCFWNIHSDLFKSIFVKRLRMKVGLSNYSNLSQHSYQYKHFNFYLLQTQAINSWPDPFSFSQIRCMNIKFKICQNFETDLVKILVFIELLNISRLQ